MCAGDDVALLASTRQCTRNGVKETKTVHAPNNYALETEQLSLCVLTGEKPHVSREFSLMTARVTDRILQAAGY